MKLFCQYLSSLCCTTITMPPSIIHANHNAPCLPCPLSLHPRHYTPVPFPFVTISAFLGFVSLLLFSFFGLFSVFILPISVKSFGTLLHCLANFTEHNTLPPPSMLLEMVVFTLSLWLSNILLCLCTTFYLFIS